VSASKPQQKARLPQAREECIAAGSCRIWAAKPMPGGTMLSYSLGVNNYWFVARGNYKLGI
jgi:hypothetical protein